MLSVPASFAVLGSYGNHPLGMQQLIPYTPGLARKLAPSEAARPLSQDSSAGYQGARLGLQNPAKPRLSTLRWSIEAVRKAWKLVIN